jgi:hypothetical protein
MAQSSTLFIGMNVHKDAIAVAYVAPDHGAEVTALVLAPARATSITSYATGNRRPHL